MQASQSRPVVCRASKLRYRRNYNNAEAQGLEGLKGLSEQELIGRTKDQSTK